MSSVASAPRPCGNSRADTQVDYPEQQCPDESSTPADEDVRQPFHPNEQDQQDHDLYDEGCFSESHQLSRDQPFPLSDPLTRSLHDRQSSIGTARH